MTINKKTKYIFLFVVILITDFLLLRFHGLINHDQIFCFGFANAILNGHVPYNDFNMIIFPLYPYLMAPFSKNLLTFHMFNAFLQAGIYSHITYLIKNKPIKITFILFILLKITLFPFLDYNILMIYFVIISYIFLKKYFISGNKYFLLLTGMFLSIGLITKHSLPAIIIVVLTIAMLIYSIKSKKIIDFIFYAIGGCAPVLLLLIIAYFNGYLFNMIDFVILSMPDFSAWTKTTDNIIRPIDQITTILTIVFIFLSAFLATLKKNKNVIYYIYLLSIISLLITKDYRTALFSVFYALSIIGIELENEKISFAISIKHISSYITCSILSFAVFCFSVAAISEQIKVADSEFIITNEYEALENSRILTFSYNYIKNIEKYIEENKDKKILVVSALNRLYGISQNETYEVFDMLIAGNLGIYNKAKIPEKLKEYDLIITAQVAMEMKYEEIYTYIANTYEEIDKIPIENGYAQVFKVQ